jgi:pimeloyl-ACP methyl ester carboxylesterase
MKNPLASPLRQCLPVAGANGAASHIDFRLHHPRAGATAESADRCVLYMHGLGSSQDSEKAVFFGDRLTAAGLSVASFDFQGHGGSGGAISDLSLSRNLADIACVHAHLLTHGFERIILFGSSMGAAAALWYAALHPEGIEAAIHIAPAIDMEAQLRARVGQAGLERWQRDGRMALPHEGSSVDMAWGLIDDFRHYPDHRLVEQHATPTLIFQGVHDASVSWRAVLAFVESCQDDDIELHVFANGDHRLVDRKDHLWRLAESFLRSRGLVGPMT